MTSVNKNSLEATDWRLMPASTEVATRRDRPQTSTQRRYHGSRCSDGQQNPILISNRVNKSIDIGKRMKTYTSKQYLKTKFNRISLTGLINDDSESIKK